MRFETFYHAFACQIESLDLILEHYTRTLVDRNRCTPMYYGDGVRGFRCNTLVKTISLGHDALGDFFKYESKATGSWYQSVEYLDMKAELDRLADQALLDIKNAILLAVKTTGLWRAP